jgi:hypothetical protein
MSTKQAYAVGIDDLPEETIYAESDKDFSETLSAIVSERDSLKSIHGDVNITIFRPDGSIHTSTVAAFRRKPEPHGF